MKSLLAFWMGWSLGFLAHAETGGLQLFFAVMFIGAFALWLKVEKDEDEPGEQGEG